MAFGFTIQEFKRGFFDTAAIVTAVNEGHRIAQSKMGAFVRQRAKSSIRKREAVSAPDSPPSSHAGDLKRLIFFAFDAETLSTVIGPVAFGRGEAPGLLERGGRATRKGKPAIYRPRPFMGPAGDAEAPKFQDLLGGMVN
jgi:hypothetical protein